MVARTRSERRPAPERVVVVNGPLRRGCGGSCGSTTWPLGPSACANWLIRSSSSSHGTSASSPSTRAPGGQLLAAAAGRGPRARGSRCMRSRSTAAVLVQPLQPPLGAAQVALDVGQPVRAGRRDEAGEDEPAELLGDVAAHRVERRAAQLCPAGARTSRAACRIFTTCGDDPRGLVRGVAGDVVAQALEATPRPTPARRRWAISDEIAARRGVLEHRARRGVRRLDQHELGGVAELGALVVAQRGRDRQREQPARADAHVQRLRGRALERAQADGLALVDQRRVRARRSGRCPGSATAFGIVPNVQLVWPGALELARRGGERARAASGATFSRSASRSWPAATTLPLLVLDAERHLQVRRAGG